jgi:hypothetical protein
MLDAGSVQEKWEDIANMNVGPAGQFGSKTFGKPGQSEFAGGISNRKRRRRPRTDRDVVDQDALALGKKMRERRMSAVHVPDQIGLDDTPMRLDRGLGITAHRTDPGIVDPHPDRAETIRRYIGEPAHRLGIGDVGRNGDGMAAQALAFSRDVMEQFLTPRRERHAGTAPCKGLGGGATHPAGCTGDHDRCIAQPLHVLSFPAFPSKA